MDTNYYVKFIYGKVDETHPLKDLIKKAMELEYYQTYNKFCDITSSGLIDKMNKEFDELHPGYKVSDSLWDSIEYVNYFRKGYSEVADELNKLETGKILNYHIGDELELIGELKVFDLDWTITFILEKR